MFGAHLENKRLEQKKLPECWHPKSAESRISGACLATHGGVSQPVRKRLFRAWSKMKTLKKKTEHGVLTLKTGNEFVKPKESTSISLSKHMHTIGSLNIIQLERDESSSLRGQRSHMRI